MITNRNTGEKRGDSADKGLLQAFLTQMDKLHQGSYPEVLVFADCNKTNLDPACARI